MDTESMDIMNSEVEACQNEEWRYPRLVRRYLASFIDASLVMIMLFVLTYALQGEGRSISVIRASAILFMIFVYEPICTSKLCTLGQFIMHIRIRNEDGMKRISIPKAYARIFIKIFLGIISFISIPLNKGHRGIHDYIVGSIVLKTEAIESA